MIFSNNYYNYASPLCAKYIEPHLWKLSIDYLTLHLSLSCYWRDHVQRSPYIFSSENKYFYNIDWMNLCCVQCFIRWFSLRFAFYSWRALGTDLVSLSCYSIPPLQWILQIKDLIEGRQVRERKCLMQKR